MKPAPFEYRAPETLDEALALLAEHGADAKPLAGGQSLIPAMSFRLAQPAVLVDLRRIGDLAGIEAAGDGGLAIGTMTRQRAAERSAAVAERAPLLAETLPSIAHPQIRSRGTVGGSLAHADPAAELPAVALALGARFRIASSSGRRTLDAADFYVGLLETAMTAEELLVAVELPPPPPRTGWAFRELSRRHGDYALVGVAAGVTLDGAGRCETARLALLSVGDGPVAAARATAALAGEEPTREAIAAAAELAAGEDIDPPGDIHASADYRRQLARVLVRRALTAAAERARTAAGDSR